MPDSLDSLIAKHNTAIEELSSQLATNFDTPSQRLINAAFSRMNLRRFDHAGNDLWEMIVCRRNGSEYQKPPAHLVKRWASY